MATAAPAKTPRTKRVALKRTDPLPKSVLDDINDLADFGSKFHVEMFYSTRQWKAVTNSAHTWTVIDFPPASTMSVPTTPGVYAFVVEPPLFDFPQAGGMLYIGKATQIRNRLGSYIRTINVSYASAERKLCWRMVNLWHGYLKYYFTPTVDAAAAKELEERMLEAFSPPVNTALPAKLSAKKRAFQ